MIIFSTVKKQVEATEKPDTDVKDVKQTPRSLKKDAKPKPGQEKGKTRVVSSAKVFGSFKKRSFLTIYQQTRYIYITESSASSTCNIQI